jgi:1-acyl-sn-glycerol-3-phosphate acyltransferase
MKAVMGDFLYGAVKAIGGTALKVFNDLTIEGKENIPLFGKAILTTISKNVMLDMLTISQVSGRKVHFMLDPKLIRNPVAGPLLKSMGMFRSTESKEDTEPIDKVFDILNNKGDLVGMTPEARLSDEVQLKSIAAIIKFAIAADAPIIPLSIYAEQKTLFNFIPTTRLVVKIGTPISFDKKLNRDKYRDERYKQAAEIIKIIDVLRIESQEVEEEEEALENQKKMEDKNNRDF